MGAILSEKIVLEKDFQLLRPMPEAGAIEFDAMAEADAVVEGLDSGDCSMSDREAMMVSAGRTLRTLAPIIIGDALALFLAALMVQAVLARIFPAAVQILGRAGPLALLPLIIAYWLHDLYSEIWAHPVVEFRQLAHVTSIALLAATAAGMLAPPLPIWCISAMLPALVLVALFRNIVRQICSHISSWGYPTLVIGSGDGASQVARTLFAVPRSGLRPVIISDFHQRCRTSMLPVVNDPATLDSIIRARVIRHAVISLPDMSSVHLAKVLDRYRGVVPHVLVLSDMSTLPTLWGASRDFGRLSGIEVRNGLLLFTLRYFKRAIDVGISSIALMFFLPLIAVTALLTRLTSPGPVFYGNQRVGHKGRTFTAWKIRSMHSDAGRILEEHLATNRQAREEWNCHHKLKKDPRVTRLGTFIRRTSIDELPQLWNVLKGDMSLVGPRPIFADDVPIYGEPFRLYMSVKPGITGLWQVSGRNDISFEDRIVLDQFYIRHWSPWLDIYVLAKTIVAVLGQFGAY